MSIHSYIMKGKEKIVRINSTWLQFSSLPHRPSEVVIAKDH